MMIFLVMPIDFIPCVVGNTIYSLNLEQTVDLLRVSFPAFARFSGALEDRRYQRVIDSTDTVCTN